MGAARPLGRALWAAAVVSLLLAAGGAAAEPLLCVADGAGAHAASAARAARCRRATRARPARSCPPPRARCATGFGNSTVVVDVAAAGEAPRCGGVCTLCACAPPAPPLGGDDAAAAADAPAPPPPCAPPHGAAPLRPGINRVTGRGLLGAHAAAPSARPLRLAVDCACSDAGPSRAGHPCAPGAAAVQLLLAPGACPEGAEELLPYEIAPEDGDEGGREGEGRDAAPGSAAHGAVARAHAYVLQLRAGARPRAPSAACGSDGCLVFGGNDAPADGGVSWVAPEVAARLLHAGGERGPPACPVPTRAPAPAAPLVWAARAVFSAAVAAGCTALLARRA